MKQTTLLGSVAAGLMAAAIASPAWAQAATYPKGTDCSAVQNSASRTECMNQMEESRQNPNSGQSTDPSTGTPTGVAPGSADEPSTLGTPGGPEDGTAGNPSNAPSTNGTGTGTGGTGTGGTGAATQ
ncbi:hypothetical protein [Dongia sp. agr-C8]